MQQLVRLFLAHLVEHAHDELETIYNPFVNFAGVYALAEQEAQCLLNRRGQTERPGIDAQQS